MHIVTFEQETLAQSTKDHLPYTELGKDLKKYVLQVFEEVNTFSCHKEIAFTRHFLSLHKCYLRSKELLP